MMMTDIIFRILKIRVDWKAINQTSLTGRKCKRKKMVARYNHKFNAISAVKG